MIKIDERKRERAMEMLAVMTVMCLVEEGQGTIDEVYRRFRRSKTFENLFDPDTGVWMNGPTYIADDYLLN